MTTEEIQPRTAGGMIAEMMLKHLRIAEQITPLYIEGRRVHHGEVGLVLHFLGRAVRSPDLLEAGAILSNDDLADSDEWCLFRTPAEEKRKNKH